METLYIGEFPTTFQLNFDTTIINCHNFPVYMTCSLNLLLNCTRFIIFITIDETPILQIKCYGTMYDKRRE